MLREIYHTLLPLSVRTKLNLGNRLKRSSVKMVKTKKVAVSETSILDYKFLMVSDVNEIDPVSLEARSGTLTLEAPLMSILDKRCCFLDVGANIG
ncbi:MAG: hypothetical protein IJ702_07190, partial [Fretibacterium sp.]|nr:hypothetical protein [Fretibacterium sp.]